MLSSSISAATRHLPILVLTLVFFRLIPSIYSWLAKPSSPGPWRLSYEDVLEARAILGTLKLPTELALQILDYAEYWPSLTFSSPQNPHGSSIKAAATHTAPSAATLCLAADILTPELYPALKTVVSHGETPRVKAIEFSILSRDQGWTSEPTHGTFSTSSWLEVSLLRGWHPDARSQVGSNAQRVGVDTSLPPSCWLPSVFESPEAFQTHIVSNGWRLVERPEEAEQGPQGGEGRLAWYLQGNRVATQGRCEQYSVRWTRSGDAEGNEGCGTGEGFLEKVQEGDQVLVWARAKWPGWQCVVERVEATVYYGFS